MIIQSNIYICDVCGETKIISIEVLAYSDPVVTLPNGWDYHCYFIGNDDRLHCKECVEKRNKNDNPNSST